MNRSFLPPQSVSWGRVFEQKLGDVSVFSISVYQKHLSPRKGFSCAHRVLYKGESCSQYAKQQILEVGLSDAFRGIKTRFQECSHAAQILKREREEQKKDREQQSDAPPIQESGQFTGTEGLSNCCEGVVCLADGVDCVPELDCTPDIDCCGCGP